MAVTDKICHSVTQIEHLEYNLVGVTGNSDIKETRENDKAHLEMELNGTVYVDKVKTNVDDVQNSRL